MWWMMDERMEDVRDSSVPLVKMTRRREDEGEVR
jgi:hypothetical protein